tara:strand:- start:42 stop:656 length:615 start_codon:yes stop_codon:yes gene_type:complete
VNYLIIGFFTGLSLILALGAQNIFVIEQGLKKQYVFLVCLICSISDLILIFLGIYLFEYFRYFFNNQIELIFNILLLLFLLYFIVNKIRVFNKNINLSIQKNTRLFKEVMLKCLGFTYLNPHVYSDTVFFLGNFSKNFLITNKYSFGFGASIASFLFFFSLGYLAKFFSNNLVNSNTWKTINFFIVIFMTVLSSYVFMDIIDLI